MKINRQRNTKKIIIISIVAILVICAGIGVWLYAQHENTDSDSTLEIKKEKTTKESDKTSDKNKPQESTQSPPSTETESPDNTSTGSVSQDGHIIQRDTGSGANSGSISITRVDSSDTQVVATAIVHGTQSGNCDFTFTHQGDKIAKTTPIQAGPTYYACQINVPRGEFTSSGSWQITATISGTSVTTTTEKSL